MQKQSIAIASVVYTKELLGKQEFYRTHIPVCTKHCWYRLYCSDIVAYACMIIIVESHCHCQYTPSNGATTHLLTCVHVGAVIIL